MKRNEKESCWIFMLGRPVAIIAGSALLCVLFLLVLYPVGYVRLVSASFPFEPLDRIALSLTGFHVRHGLNYGCDNPVYFGYKTPFGVEIPGIPRDETYRFQTEKREHLAFFFASDIDLPENWVASRPDIETYNLMVLAKCQ